MTETTTTTQTTKSGKSSRGGRASSSAAGSTPVTAESPAAGSVSTDVVPVDRTTGADGAAGATTPRSLTIGLPFLTVTFTGPGRVPVAVPAPPAAAGGQGGVGDVLEKLAFYGGVAAAGALGAIEWPVATAVAAGTWVAQHTSPAASLLRWPRKPAAAQPASEDPAARESTQPAERQPATAGAGG